VSIPFVLAACGEVKPMLKRTWVADKVVAPTCTEQGYTIYIDADDLTASYKGDFTLVDHEAHDWENGTSEVIPPTCMERGYTIHYCAHNPKHFYKDEYTPIDPNAHNWVVNTDYKIGDYDGKTIIYVDPQNPENPTPLPESDPRAGTHDWEADNGVVLSNCVNRGYTAYYCTHNPDDHVKIEYIIDGAETEIDSSGHNWVIDTDYTVGDYDEKVEGIDIIYESDETKRLTAGDLRIAVNGVVPANCLDANLANGYRAYVCSFSGNVVKVVFDENILPKEDDGSGYSAGEESYSADEHHYDNTGHHWLLYRDYELDGDPRQENGLIANGVVQPTCSTKGYTVYKCEYCDEYKYTDFVDADPTVHHPDYGVVYTTYAAASPSKPEILRSYCAYSQNENAMFYVGSVHYMEKYAASAIALDSTYALTLPAYLSHQWVRLSVANDTFVKLSTSASDGVAEITLYQFIPDDDATPEVFEVFTPADEAAFSNAMPSRSSRSAELYVTLNKDAIYYINITRIDEDGGGYTGSFTVTKILDTEPALAAYLYAAEGGIRSFSGGAYTTYPGFGTNYGNQAQITVTTENGTEIIVFYAAQADAKIYNNHKTRAENSYKYFTKVYRFGTDVFTFATRSTAVAPANAQAFQSAVDAVLNGYGKDADSYDSYYMWAFTVHSSNDKYLANYYGLDETVIIPSYFTRIGYAVGSGTSYFPFQENTTIKKVIIPDTVTIISSSAFRDCTSLTTLILPSSVTTISNSAFSGCTGLTDVFYGGTPEKFAKISMGTGNENLTDNIIYYSETAPDPDGTPDDPTDDILYWRYVNGIPTKWPAAE
jgi:hypothetical protein